MSALAKLTRSAWIPGIANIGRNRRYKGIGDWLVRSGYQVTGRVPEASRVEIAAFDSRTLIEAIASDVLKYASAATETLQNLTRPSSLPRSQGWYFIKAYYAAFFSAHSLINTFGRSIFYVDAETADHLQDIADSYLGVSAIKLKTGTYVFRYNAQVRSITIEPANQNIRGAHEILWDLFSSSLSDLVAQLSTMDPNTDVQLSISKLDDLGKCLRFRGLIRGNWLSKMRNDINYKFSHGMWFPYREQHEFFPKALHRVELTSGDPLRMLLEPSSKHDVLRFLQVASFICSYAAMTMKEIQNSSPTEQSFIREGPLAVELLTGQHRKKARASK